MQISNDNSTEKLLQNLKYKVGKLWGELPISLWTTELSAFSLCPALQVIVNQFKNPQKVHKFYGLLTFL